MKKLITLWQFSRPHTIIGTVVSISTLYIMLCGRYRAEHISLLLLALLTGITANIFIVGINQVADVNIDKINKPWLPIPSGALNVKQALVIVYVSLLVSLSIAFYVTPYFFLFIALSSLIGWAYSMPPLHLKQHHLPAALAISLVRGLIMNAGAFVVFSKLMKQDASMPENLKILTMFITVFAIVIAWFKDLPDVEGDGRHNIRTLAVLYSPKTALIAGNLLLGTAYLLTIGIKFRSIYFSGDHSKVTGVLFYGHLVLFALFVVNGSFVNRNDQRSLKQFYKRFWWFFFAEYLLYLFAYI